MKPLTRRALSVYVRWEDAGEFDRRTLQRVSSLSPPEIEALHALETNLIAARTLALRGWWYQRKDHSRTHIVPAVIAAIIADLEFLDGSVEIMARILRDEAGGRDGWLQEDIANAIRRRKEQPNRPAPKPVPAVQLSMAAAMGCDEIEVHANGNGRTLEERFAMLEEAMGQWTPPVELDKPIPIEFTEDLAESWSCVVGYVQTIIHRLRKRRGIIVPRRRRSGNARRNVA